MNLNKLWKVSRPITEDKAYLNKYTYFGYFYKAPHYRMLTIGDIIKGKFDEKELPKYFVDFVGEQGEVVVIFNIVCGQVCLAMARSVRGEKAFSVAGSQTKLFHGQGYLSQDFKYGDYIVLVEGHMDRDVLSCIYPNVFAVMSAGLTTSQSQIIKYMTNNIILAYDNDTAGVKGSKRDFFRLKKDGYNVKLLKHYSDFKDIGDLMEQKYIGETFKFELGLKYYQNTLKNLIRN